ncbi:DUF968 domain-containing protein [Escherichia coli]|nr:DUF968 domain-containing protein [Escherichia coli]
MRALLTPEIAPRMGIVLFRPGSELMPLFMQGRVLLEPEPERYSSFASGAVPAASQPLADDPAVRAVFRNEAVIRRAGGVECLESWLLREKGCQWPHSDWHSENMTTMRHAPGAIRLCWHCDNQLRDQFTERLESMATDNCARWVLSVVRRDLGFDDSHVVTMPELCWWLIRNDLADALPESAARKALRLPKPVVPSVTRESDLVPSVPATSIIQDKAKKVLALKVDPESPESFMLRPKRHRWVNEKYTRWVKTQPCACCGRAVFRHEAVIRRAGGVECLESWLLREKGCQWPHSGWHSENMTTMRHAPGAIRLCWHCDNQLRDQFTERLESMATDNCARWVLSVVRRDLGFDDSHVVTMPELCWWLIRNDLADALPESAARKALRLPKPVVPSVTRESDLVPSVPATSIIQDKAKKVLALKVDPESPESFMLRPKRRRWVNEKYTRWVKTQPCACCGKPADDPHHLIGHGQGGMGTKAHDLFVLPLCRKHHDELHADTVAFEEKYGSQLELIFRFIDRALAIGVLA